MNGSTSMNHQRFSPTILANNPLGTASRCSISCKRRWLLSIRCSVCAPNQRTGDTPTVAGATYDLRSYRRVYVVGAGKAGASMAAAVAAVLGDRLDDGLVVVKYGHGTGRDPSVIAVVEAGHPMPDAAGVLLVSVSSPWPTARHRR